MNTELIYELRDYILVDGNGRVLDTARLTKREALAKNQAFGHQMGMTQKKICLIALWCSCVRQKIPSNIDLFFPNVLNIVIAEN